MFRVLLLSLALCGGSAGQAWAQAASCRIPDQVPVPRAVVPRRGEARPGIAVAGYTLALSWSPQHCAQQDDPRQDSQCSGRIGDFGFILHGLWPEGAGAQWPQYCRAAPVIPRAVIAANLCVMPSARLMQHQWAKHGTCITARPDAYFTAARRLFQAVRFPDMAALARDRRLTAGRLIAAFAARNPGIRPDMMRVRGTHDGWLDEVWLCLGRDFRPRACPGHKGGMRADAPLRVRSAG